MREAPDVEPLQDQPLSSTLGINLLTLSGFEIKSCTCFWTSFYLLIDSKLSPTWSLNRIYSQGKPPKRLRGDNSIQKICGDSKSDSATQRREIAAPLTSAWTRRPGTFSHWVAKTNANFNRLERKFFAKNAKRNLASRGSKEAAGAGSHTFVHANGGGSLVSESLHLKHLQCSYSLGNHFEAGSHWRSLVKMVLANPPENVTKDLRHNKCAVCLLHLIDPYFLM